MESECLASMRRRVHALIDELDEVNLVVQYDYLSWLLAHQEDDERLNATPGTASAAPPSDIVDLWRRPHSSSDGGSAAVHSHDADIFVDLWRREAGF